MFKKIGTAYLFKDHFTFASSVFGMNHTEVLPLVLVTDISLEDDTMKIECRGKKLQFL
jgi:hypothetical protein